MAAQTYMQIMRRYTHSKQRLLCLQAYGVLAVTANALSLAVVLTAQSKVVLHTLMEASDIGDSLAELCAPSFTRTKGAGARLLQLPPPF